MIEFLKGQVAFKAEDYIVIEVNNIGYKVFMAKTSIEQIDIEVNNIGYKVFMAKTSIEQIDTNNIIKIFTYMRVLQDDVSNIIKIFTYMRVLQDDVSLFGFLSNEELNMFELLITVGGIGAKSALSILSNITPTDFAMAVVSDDVNKLKSLPGIGPKTAVLELKDKMKHEQIIEESKNIEKQIQENENIKDAISALQVLGYNLKSIEKAFEKIETSSKTTEDLIKDGLKELS